MPARTNVLGSNPLMVVSFAWNVQVKDGELCIRQV
jgi:hypothetical protein